MGFYYYERLLYTYTLTIVIFLLFNSNLDVESHHVTTKVCNHCYHQIIMSGCVPRNVSIA